MKHIKTYTQYIKESETSSYDPPKYLASPALDQEGNGTVDDEMGEWLRGEKSKSMVYFTPGIKSTNNPKE